MKSATDKTQPSTAGCLVPLPPDRLISLAELTNATAAVVEPNDCTYRIVDRQTPRAVGSFSPRGMVKEVHIVALMSAIDGGTVTARSLHTRVPYGESEHIHFDWARTSVAYGLTYADAKKFCERLALEARPIDETPDVMPAAPKAFPATGDGEAWKVQAQREAEEIIKRHREKDLHPSQVDVADEIAKGFRQTGIVGVGGKPLTGAYIKRHALKGISSAHNRQLSTSIRRGK